MGANSIKLNTTITIRNPDVNEYMNAFFDTARDSRSKITINYTNETESLVERLVACACNTNVVKGVLVD